MVPARLSLSARRALWAWAFLAVPIVFYVTIRLYPAVDAFVMSFTNWNIVGTRAFNGLDNYLRLFGDPRFWTVLRNTFVYLGAGLVVSMGLAFAVAYHLDKVRFGHGFLRALYFVPHITTAVAMAWVWRWFYQPVPVGLFNDLLVAVGLPQQPFLRSTGQALFAILAPAVWAGIGFQIVIFLAGLKAIPAHYYEAAALDGAGPWRVLFEITLPLLRPTVVFLTVTSSIAYLRIFDYVYAMTLGTGGPLDSTKPIVLMIFETAFKNFEMGYAAAQTVVLFLILLAISLLQLRLMDRRP
ncbi:sugar ABC transporter permease [Chelatococcus sp. SYSU_G07232]|uniref:Sugar ABC transporter permease n=1 Tax=Chelatococcus albus TaxID=3047466 RepID=A0ABT7AKX8_9HYPH|nr:sugar ABC transporter permease [Chelatococcus sp. SYSU_G07232]MDJ1160034.1 sugar ABC transporter permease [Chelatococcus sp. SYSU_G07232]